MKLIYCKIILLSKIKSLYINEDYVIEWIYYTNSKNFINSKSKIVKTCIFVRIL